MKKDKCLHRQIRYIATNINFKILILHLFLIRNIYSKQLYAKVRYFAAW